MRETGERCTGRERHVLVNGTSGMGNMLHSARRLPWTPRCICRAYARTHEEDTRRVPCAASTASMLKEGGIPIRCPMCIATAADLVHWAPPCLCEGFCMERRIIRIDEKWRVETPAHGRNGDMEKLDRQYVHEEPSDHRQGEQIARARYET
ncbi:hypothetical protein BD309DRAFT_972041 [Dichomitus squalens]|nr:hypothetical protein BD309DRAFT_972041 [Dichomitus squalens]